MDFKSKNTTLFKIVSLLIISTLLSACGDNVEKIGHVNTRFKLLGKSDRIEVATFSDPDVLGIQCFISHAQTGGMKEVIHMEEDVSDASITCVKSKDVITFNPTVVSKPRTVYKRDTNITFKSQQVKSYYDENSSSFIYLVYSDKILDGSPKNSLSAISCNDGNDADKLKNNLNTALDKSGKPIQSIVGNCLIDRNFINKQ